MDAFVLLSISGLSIGALYFLMASGLSLIFGLMGVLSFAHGAFVALGAYAGYALLSTADIAEGAPPWLFALAVIAAMAAGAAIAYFTELLLIQPLYNRSHMDTLLVTMGLGFIISALIAGVWGPDERSLPLPLDLRATTNILGAEIPNDRFVTIAAGILVYLAIEVFLRKTRHGLIVRAGVQNREMVRALGIDVRKSFTLVFVLGGIAAGLGGLLAGMYQRAVTPYIGDHLLLYAFIVLIIGGLGSIGGALVAAVIVGLTQVLANFYISPGFGDVLVVVLMAAMLLVRPQGLFGRKGRLV